MLRLGPLIVRHVLRNRRRTRLTLASTLVSLVLLSLLAALYQGFFYSEPQTPMLHLIAGMDKPTGGRLVVLDEEHGLAIGCLP